MAKDDKSLVPAGRQVPEIRVDPSGDLIFDNVPIPKMSISQAEKRLLQVLQGSAMVHGDTAAAKEALFHIRWAKDRSAKAREAKKARELELEKAKLVADVAVESARTVTDSEQPRGVVLMDDVTTIDVSDQDVQ